VTYHLGELDIAELAGCIDRSQLKTIFTSNDGIHGTRETGAPNTTEEEELEDFKEFEVATVEGQKDLGAGWK
jgi:hypothetical protein